MTKRNNLVKTRSKGRLDRGGNPSAKTLRGEVGPRDNCYQPVITAIREFYIYNFLTVHAHSGFRELLSHQNWCFVSCDPPCFPDQKPMELKGLVSSYPSGRPAFGLCLSYDFQATVLSQKLTKITIILKPIIAIIIYCMIPHTQ